MKNSDTNILKINSVVALHYFLNLPSPFNPLITIIDHSKSNTDSQNQKLVLDFYNITIKRSFKGQLKYGKNKYDFDEGTMSFVAPNQIIEIDNEVDKNNDGWSLLFHPDLIRQYPLIKTIKNYGFFSYQINEALHLSDDEEKTIEIIVKNIQNEINSRLDNFSHDVIVSNLELLLSYCNRFYTRQFLTRKMATNDLLTNFEYVLENYFSKNADLLLPTVDKIARELNVSSAYLSDMLRNLTGLNTQQHIHNKLIEKAKEILTTTQLSVSDI
jgi:AraC family transcriptional regulator, transcriptional activator of pobA